MDLGKRYDVIVIGGGHAGTEAALAAARMKSHTLLLTQNIETLGQMSCNPAIGGIGKGHLVKEIDALGGAMAEAADRAGIQFRILNASKGPAVRATRVQADRVLYKEAIRHILEREPFLDIFQQTVSDLIVVQDQVIGVVTQMGVKIHAKAVVLTTGTFLNGKIHVGMQNVSGGRAGDPASMDLAARLRELPLHVGRLKTGTPPRIDGRTLDYTKMQPQFGEDPIPRFSFLANAQQHPRQVPCYITHTTEETHDIIRDNLASSPMYAGVIEGVGPRYCPSIEDKIVRFADKTSHQIFIEPEGLSTSEIYPNGISTSLPFEVQCAFVRTIIGCEKVQITRPGYAIEYDYFDPRDLKSSLETKYIGGLFFAGQINGTTGYEEAAAQGLIAGINAALQVKGEPHWTPGRDEAYIGVLIDDLITQGTTEPYRMFTSRAEYRLYLREDNADLRLTPKGRDLGLVNDVRWQLFSEKKEAIAAGRAFLKSRWLRSQDVLSQKVSEHLGIEISRDLCLLDLLKRPEIHYKALAEIEDLAMPALASDAYKQLEIEIKYGGYLERQALEIERLRKSSATLLPSVMDYRKISGLSAEIVQKLSNVMPETLGQAARIAGVTPAAISILTLYVKKYRNARAL